MEEGLDEMRAHLSSFLIDLANYQEERVIGKGAYGKVYLATNKQTGEKYAIKELFFEHLEGRQLKLFCREVQILAKCDQLFLLPLTGFTLSHPYSIVTEYIPNGSLYEALRHRPNSPVLSPTNKTIIAMGIAHGMMHLHDLNIIHRDLKSLNILLDENICPKICDFGIARFKEDVNQLVTQQIGTPHWMAPELFGGNKYDSKVDVYAYGIILWELLTEQTPFRGRCPMQIMSAVCQGRERPLMPSNVPKPLEDLITLCWAQTPEERPTFKIVYRLFKEGKVWFEGTDMKAIDAFAQSIADADSLRKGGDLPVFDDIELPVVDELDMCEPECSDAVDALWTAGEAGVGDLLDQIASAFSNFSDEKVCATMRGLRALVNRGAEFVNILKEHSLYNMLPFDKRAVFGPLYDLVFDMLKVSPSALPVHQFKKMLEISSGRTRELASLIALAAKGYGSSYVSDQMIATLIENIRVFMNKDSGVLVLSILHDLMIRSSDFREKYSELFSEILIFALSHSNKNIINAAYRVLLNHWNEDLVPANVSKHLKHKKTAPLAIKVLLKSEKLSLKEKTIIQLAQMPQTSDTAKLLLRAARTPDQPQILLSTIGIWIGNNGMTNESALRLVLTTLQNADTSQMNEAARVKLCSFLDTCLTMTPAPLSTVCSIISRIERTPSLLNYCETSGFTKRFVNAVISKADFDTGIAFARLMSGAMRSDSFGPLFDSISECNEEAKPAARHLQELCARNECVM